MNNLAYAAISLVAPTLFVSLSSYIIEAYRTKSIPKAAEVASERFCTINYPAMLFLWLDTFGRRDHTDRRVNNFVSVALPLLFVSSTCTYIALTSNLLFAIGAAVSILPVCSNSFYDSVAERKLLKDISEKLFATCFTRSNARE